MECGIMARISVTLQLNEHGADKITSMTADVGVNNVSKAVVWGSTSRNAGFNGICIGKWQIGEAGYLIAQSTGYNGFLFSPTDSDGNGELEITFTGTAIDSITFYGDPSSGQWATEAILDEGTLYETTTFSDDYVWSIIFSEPASSHTVKFTKWERPNYNMLFTHIEIFPNTMTFDSQSIKEFSSLSQSNSNPKEVFYGVLPNSGSIDIIDRDGELKDYAVEGYLNKQTFTIVISINDQEVQHHITIESPYYNNQRFLELNLTNSLSQWNNINFLGFSYEFTETLYEVLTSIFSISLDMESEDVDDMLDTVINIGSEDITVKQYLNRIIIEDIDLEQSSLREAVDKVCNVALLQVIENDEGEIKFISARPLATQDEKDNAKVIPLKMQKKEFEYEILLSNKYEDVDFM
jgi:hypothetical protein